MTKKVRCCKTLRWARASSNLAGCLVAAALLVAGAALPARSGENWPPIPPEELALKDDPLNPGAHAMILYREMHTDDVKRFQTHYYRIKIFTEKGKKYADIEIPYLEKQQQVEDIQARTVRPNGTAVDFNGQVFDKVVVKAKKLKFRAKTFTLPEVQRGSIIEYSYKVRWGKKAPDVLRHPEKYIVRGTHSMLTAHWIVQHKLSTRRARFSIRPIPSAHIEWAWMGLPKDVAPRRQPDGTIQLEVENILAFQEEEYMPPENVLKSRVDFFYVLGFGGSPKLFWRKQAEQRAEGVEKFIGNSERIRRAAAALISSNDSPEEKLRKLYARVLPRGLMREKTEKERKRKKLKKNKNAEDVLKGGHGSHDDFNRLFVALARAAGFEAAIVLVSGRKDHFFQENVLDAGQLDTQVVVVRLGEEELYLDPGTPYTPFGLLLWDRTGVKGFRVEKPGVKGWGVEREGGVPVTTPSLYRELLSARVERVGGVPVTTPEPRSADALTERRATLKLGEDGSLTGKVLVAFHGQEALRRRLAAIEEDKLGRRKQLEEEVKGWFPAGAKVEIEKVSHWEDPEEPLRVEATVEVPEFAVSAGRRLLVPLGIFQTKEKHPFEHAKRVHPIYFRYPWEEKDDVILELPARYQVEAMPEAQKVPAGDALYEISCEKQPSGLQVRRRLVMNALLLPQKVYPGLRNFFSKVKAGDEQLAVLQAMEVGQRE